MFDTQGLYINCSILSPGTIASPNMLIVHSMLCDGIICVVNRRIYY